MGIGCAQYDGEVLVAPGRFALGGQQVAQLGYGLFDLRGYIAHHFYGQMGYLNLYAIVNGQLFGTGEQVVEPLFGIHRRDLPLKESADREADGGVGFLFDGSHGVVKVERNARTGEDRIGIADSYEHADARIRGFVFGVPLNVVGYIGGR